MAATTTKPATQAASTGQCIGSCHPVAHQFICPMNPRNQRRQQKADIEYAISKHSRATLFQPEKADQTAAAKNSAMSVLRDEPITAVLGAFTFMSLNNKPIHSPHGLECLSKAELRDVFQTPEYVADDLEISKAAEQAQDEFIQQQFSALCQDSSSSADQKSTPSVDSSDPRAKQFRQRVSEGSAMVTELWHKRINKNNPIIWKIPPLFTSCAHSIAIRLTATLAVDARIHYVGEDCLAKTCLQQCHHADRLSLSSAAATTAATASTTSTKVEK